MNFSKEEKDEGHKAKPKKMTFAEKGIEAYNIEDYDQAYVFFG